MKRLSAIMLLSLFAIAGFSQSYTNPVVKGFKRSLRCRSCEEGMAQTYRRSSAVSALVFCRRQELQVRRNR